MKRARQIEWDADEWQGHQYGCKLILGTYSHVSNTHAEELARLLTASQPTDRS